MDVVFETKFHSLLQLSEVIRVADKDGGVRRLLFCVLFWVQMGIICLHVLKILGDIVRTLDGYLEVIIVLGLPQEECDVPITMLDLD